MTSVVGARGQVTIPKALRDRLGLRPGDRVEFTFDEDGIRIERTDPNNPFTRLVGIARRHEPVDDIIDTLRGSA